MFATDSSDRLHNQHPPPPAVSTKTGGLSGLHQRGSIFNADSPRIGVKLARRITPALAGAVAGHPALGDRSIVTSDLCALDAAAGWARTSSRFYRLGRPGGAARGRDQ
ncbi:DUF6634 family protein [Methylocapsa aurea]|uniref:DUF6634 family protein n=1 Tax=Methylocapsa aurea TaxID=663610 RepID=UPI003D18C0B0